jgi:hypothetical protein
MNLHKLIHKHYVSIFFFIILLALIAGLLAGQKSTSAGTGVPDRSANTIDRSSVMSGMNMFALSPFETAPHFPLS